MRGLSIILAGLIQIFGSFLFAQQYTSGYSTGYERDPYQPSRSYPLVVYHPEPAPTTCLTCNDCQVVNQPVLLPMATVLHLIGARTTTSDVQLDWEIISSGTFKTIELRWWVESESDAQTLILFSDESLDSYLHGNPPTSSLLYQLVATDEAGRNHFSNVVEIQSVEGTPGLIIYPNPGTDLIWLTVDGLTESTSVVMRDLHGREVAKWEQLIPLANRVNIEPPSSLSRGLYTLELRSQSRSWQGRWIRL